VPCTTTLKQLGSMPLSMHVTGLPSLSFITPIHAATVRAVMINPYDSSDQGSGEFSEVQRVIGERLFRVLPRVDLATRIGNAEGIGYAIRYGFIEPLREALDGIDDVTELAQRGYAADQARIGNAILTSTRLRARNCLFIDPLTVPRFQILRDDDDTEQDHAGARPDGARDSSIRGLLLVRRGRPKIRPDFPSGPVRDLRSTVATNAVR
jgi:hypothetical protein